MVLVIPKVASNMTVECRSRGKPPQTTGPWTGKLRSPELVIVAVG